MCPLEDKRMDRDNILQELRRFKGSNHAFGKSEDL